MAVSEDLPITLVSALGRQHQSLGITLREASAVLVHLSSTAE